MVKKKEKLTILDLKKKKASKERLAMVAIGEFLSAQWAEAAGIDIIGNYLTEINVTSPTGLKQINKLNNVNLEKIYWNKLEEKFFNKC